MRVDLLGSGGAEQPPTQSGPGPESLATACGGFRVLFEADAPEVRLLPGARRLAPAVLDAVLRGLDEAPRLLSRTLQLRPPQRPFERVEVALDKGALTQGEAMPLGAGVIRLCVGEEAPPDDAARLARHEALHLYLAAALQGGERWSDPELAFADWIVRGIEGELDARLPRFHPPLPRVLEEMPTSRAEVQRQLANVKAAPGAARRYFGERLFQELTRLQGEHAAQDLTLVEQKQLWLVEATLGTHFIEAAGHLHLDGRDAVLPVVLDDWLLDYERHARELANAPSGAGNLWRIPAAGWSRDVVVRLSVAAQALQCEDHGHFGGERASSGEALVWKNGGRVRLPLLRVRPRARPAPLHGFRAALRELRSAEAELALSLIEQAGGGGAHLFEARALWPRILSRLLAAGLVVRGSPRSDEPVPAVQLVAPGGGPEAARAFAEWSEAAAALRAAFGEGAHWVPRVIDAPHAAALLEAPRAAASVLLVHTSPLGADGRTLADARRLAARLPVRGALFRDHLDGGAAYERVPDLPAPIDPRYREEVWLSAPAPVQAATLVEQVDAATVGGSATTPLSHLLAMSAVGLMECHYMAADGTTAT